VYFIRERIPVRRARYEGAETAPRRVPFTFVKRNTFYAFVLSILFTSLGNFLPSIYLPSYAADLGLSQSNGTLLVVMMKCVSSHPPTKGYYPDIYFLQCVLNSRLACARPPQRQMASSRSALHIMHWCSPELSAVMGLRYKLECACGVCPAVWILRTRVSRSLDTLKLKCFCTR